MPKIIAIIPAYNEEKHIEEIINRAKKYVDRVIVVDDGSTDSTYKKSKSADIILRHAVNLGKGAALKTGFITALKNNADIIITLDADGQNNPEDIPIFIEALEKHNADIVVGARKLNKNMPVVFRIGNWGLRKIFQALFSVKVNDSQSGFRAVRADIYPMIKWQSTNYSVEAEMLANAGRNNLKCIEVPIATKYLNRYKGTTIIDGINIFIQMVIWRLRQL